MTAAGRRHLVGEQGPELFVLLCSARFYRCCGEGTLKCERPADHAGEPHTAEGVDW